MRTKLSLSWSVLRHLLHPASPLAAHSVIRTRNKHIALVKRGIQNDSLTFIGPTEFSIKLQTRKSEWYNYIVYILRGHRFQFLKNILFLSLKIDAVLANSVDPVEMQHKAKFIWVLIDCQSNHLGLFQKKIPGGGRRHFYLDPTTHGIKFSQTLTTYVIRKAHIPTTHRIK